MKISEFINNLNQDGFKFEVIGSRLSVSSQKATRLTDEQKKYIKENQKHIIEFVNDNNTQTPRIRKIENKNIFPLSFAQQRLWFIDKLYKDECCAYNMPVSYTIKGQLDVSLLETSFNHVLQRHAILRTVFRQDAEGNTYQKILPFDSNESIKIITTKINSGDVDKFLSSESLHKFDLSSGPLIRVVVFDLIYSNEKILLINQHHIISDHWSLGLLFRELSNIYNSLRSGEELQLPPLDIQYADYVIWERDNLQHENLINPFNYWSKNLKGYSDLNLISTENRLKFQKNSGSNITFQIEKSIISILKKYAKEHNSTVHMVLLSIFYVVLYRYSGQSDIVIGVPFSNREHHETENIIGFFVNMLPHRINMDNPTVDELVDSVRDICINSYQNQNYPFEYLVEQLKVKRDNSRTPIFQVAFSYYTVTEDLNLDGAVVKKIDFNRGTAKYDLNLTFEMNDSCLKGELEFSSSLFNLKAANNFVDSYKVILQDALRNHKKKISSLKFLSQSSYDEIIYKKNLREIKIPINKAVHQLFEEQAEKKPDHVALVFGDNQLTYRGLNERSNQLANILKVKYKKKYKKDIGKNVFIGLHIDRSLETVIAILSVLKCGAGYVPFDVDAPSERVKFQISDSNCSMIITKSNKNSDLFRTTKEDIVLVDLEEIRDELPKHSRSNLNYSTAPDDPIYIIYTSGSTGKPKGVVQLHHNVRRLFLACEEHFQFTDKDVWTLFHSYSFDFSVWEIWGALLYGGKLIILTYLETRDLQGFYDLLNFHQVTALNQTPSAFYELAKIDINGGKKLNYLRYIVFGGELLKIPRLKDWISKYGIDNPKLINMYGITEITVHATYKRITNDDLKSSASNIGKPLNDMTAYVLDKNLNPLPIGISGELYIGGCGLARCYLNQPELTSKKFISNPFFSENDKKNNFNFFLYRTGDVVRWLENGDLEYVGRNDNQIQLRGFRIELEEIENKLSSHPCINNVAVLCKEKILLTTESTAPDDVSLKYLCAYYTVNEKIHSSETLTSKSLREYMSALLPDYMVPSYFLQLDNFPLTINGKIDKNSLPEPDFSDNENNANFVAPRNELEQKLCNIWQNILGLKKVSINSNFFEIGGNSILLIRLVAKIKKELNLNLSLVDIFTYPNIKSLIEHLTGNKEVNTINNKKRKSMSKNDIAVIGYSGAFSGCDSIEELWNNIFNGIDCITRLSIEDATKMGISKSLLERKEYIRATGLVADVDKFDADFFGISPSEAKFMDPQTRLFIEHSWKALENAGYISKRNDISVGVFAGAGKPTYLYDNLRKNRTIQEDGYDWEMDTLADPRRLATLTSFYLNLNGPSIFLDTACSTSMVAIIEAAIHLQGGLCDLAITGGSTLYFPENFGYLYKNSMVGSSDGICAPFSKDASGIVPGSGVGVVVLKRLEDAIEDKDTVCAVIKGYGINNDGKRKVGYVAPSVSGQKDCILSALNSANVPRESISYIECHGTGTKLGDSIEISALKEIFITNNPGIQKQFLGSIKANIGHTDTAAGIASFIKVCKMFESKKIPPQINCEVINDQINDENIAFNIAKKPQDWKVDKYPRRAGLTSLGVGGTNVHIILEEINNNTKKLYSAHMDLHPTHYLFSISAKSSYSLIQAKNKLLTYLKNPNPDSLENIAYTLHTAREEFSNRYVFVGKDHKSIVKALESEMPGSADLLNGNVIVDLEKRITIVFLCTIIGRECFNLNDDLYRMIPFYRQQIDKCRNILEHYLDEEFDNIVNQTVYTDLVAFVISYALAQLLISWGIEPKYLVGIESEEYLAACISGALSLEDALYVMIKRLEIINKIKIQESVVPENNSTKTSGYEAQLRDVFSKIKLNELKIPFLSNFNGEIITRLDLIDLDYWCKPSFVSTAIEKSLQKLVSLDDVIFIDIGLGWNLVDIINRHKTRNNLPLNMLVSMVKHQEKACDYEYFLSTIGKLWSQGVCIDWDKFYENQDCHHVSLPTYSFEKKRFWVGSDIASSEVEKTEIIQKKNQNIHSNEIMQSDFIINEMRSFWSKVFEIEGIDVNRNFFDLGGNSIIAIRLIQLISDSFNVDISINTLFENPTIATFSQALAKCLVVGDSLNPTADPKQDHNLKEKIVSSHTLINEIKTLWSEVFMISDIDINSNFFDLGGNSVIAIRLVQLISDHFNAEISINTLFENQTIYSLSSVLSKNLTTSDLSFKQILPDVKNAYEPFPLTDIQRAYVLGRQNLYDLGNVATHAYIERDYHNLDIDRVESTFNKLITRHSMLRVVFDTNLFSQKILPEVPYYKIKVQHIDTLDNDLQESGLNYWREEMSHQVLDITTWPIFDIRCSVLPDKIKLHLSFDVLVLDGQSLNILMSEWTKLYNSPSIELPKLDCGFRDCVINYQDLRETKRYMRDKDYWLNRVNTFPPRPHLPIRTQPEKIKSPTFKRCTKYIDIEIWKQFTNKCNSFKPYITPTAALALIYGIVLARWSKNDHFAINMTFFNRLPLHANIDNIVGDFTSLELLELNLAELSLLNFFEKASKLQSRLYNDLDHVLFSGVELQREVNKISGNYTSVSYPIVFTSLLSLNMQGGAFLSDSLIDDTSNDITQTSQVWLDNKVYLLKLGFVAEWDYVEELFPEGMIESMHECYCKLIEYLAHADWNQTQLPELLDDRAFDLINSVNISTKSFPENLLHEPFFMNAQSAPDKMAVISATGNLTYQELAEKSNRIANCLKQYGAAPNKLVAVIMNKGWEQLAACYGILQSGAAYLPIDPDWPIARISDVLVQGQASIILTQSEVLKVLHDEISSEYNYTCLCVDNESTWNGYSSEQLSRQQNRDDIAYVLFTSGSTGKPKGAALTHQNVTNTLFDVNGRFNVNATDVILALSNLTFDLSVYDTFAVLSAGGTIVMPASNKTKDPASWVSLIVDNKVTLWNTVPMFMRMLVEYARTLTADYLNRLQNTLRVVMLSGDWIPLELPNAIKFLFKHVDVNSLGGPTECSIWSVTYKIRDFDPVWTSIPYGKALANQKIYILNDSLEYCPVDVEGHIYIAGVGVGRGYWNDNKLTSEKFIIHPKTGERIFRSGDLGKLKKDGNIEILGREDHQVKISGYRIETIEIKKAIKDLDGVDDAIVSASGGKFTDKKLIAYIVWNKKKNELSEIELLKFKKSHLNLRKNDLSNDKIKLQFPVLDQNHIDTYFKRKSYRSFTSDIIDGQIIEKIFSLQYSNALSSNKDSFKKLTSLDGLNTLLESMYAYQDKELVLPKYRYPSAGSLYPVQMYITINNQEDKNINGSYYYNPHEHLLYKINDYSDFSENDVTINFVSNLDAIRPIYGEWSEPFCELECGYMTELLERTCNKLKRKLNKIIIKDDVISQLRCLGNSKYHYTMGINFSDSTKLDYQQDLDIPVDLDMYIYIKPDMVMNFDGGLYQWKNRELKYYGAWKSSDEYLNQVGMLGSTMRSAALVIFFIGNKKYNNNFIIGKVSQYLINEALNYGIGSCPLGFLGTNLGGIFSQLQDNMLHSIVMGKVSEQQMHSHDYSEPDKSLWDLKSYINNKLKNVLPKYMLPESYLEIDKIPLSANGKVDIKALLDHGEDNSEYKQHVSPKNEIERKISVLWCEILNLKQVSINDNFFEVGGNSLKVIILRNKLSENLGFNVDIIDLFSNPTIRLLAERLNSGNGVDVSSGEVEKYSESIKKRKKMINRFIEEYEEA